MFFLSTRVGIEVKKKAGCIFRGVHGTGIASLQQSGRIETKGGRDGYPGCPLNGRRRRHSTRECYPLALVYFPAEAIGRARSGLGSAAGGPKSVMLPAPK
jgi:hypothetical protein